MKLFAIFGILSTILTCVISIMEATSKHETVFFSVSLVLWFLGFLMFIYCYEVIEK
jgi:hypothetical protein